MAVGRHGAQVALLGLVNIDAVQIIARLFGGDGEPRRINHVAHVGGGDGKGIRHVADTDRREILDRQCRKTEVRASGADHGVAVGDRDLDLGAIGELADDVVQKMRRHRRGTGCADRAFDLRRDIHVHVGGCHQQRAVGGLQHDIGQDRNGVAAFDHGLDLAERPKEADPIDGEFHGLSLLC